MSMSPRILVNGIRAGGTAVTWSTLVLQYIGNSATIRSGLQLEIPTLTDLAAKTFDV